MLATEVDCFVLATEVDCFALATEIEIKEEWNGHSPRIEMNTYEKLISCYEIVML